MNYNELLQAIKTHFHAVVGSPREQSAMREFSYSGGQLVNEEIGEMVQVDSHGGEGQGEDWWRVFHFPKHDIYIKLSAWYSSGEGTSFDSWEDDCSEVKPHEKTITVYE